MKVRSVRVKITLLAVVFVALNLVFIASTNIFSARATAADGDVSPDNSHIITIYSDGEKVTIRSAAATVQDVLQRANITLNDGDKVEPALDEVVDSDNFNINIYRTRDVVIFDGNLGQHIMTASTNPYDIAKEAGIELLDVDKVVIAPYNGILEAGSTVAYKVKRAKVVHINFYGKTVDVRTQAKTVSDLLKEQNIDSNSDKNWVSVALDTKISDDMDFSIMPQGVQLITVDEEIAFSEKAIRDYDLDYGQRQVVQYGQNGSKTVTYEVNMQDGIELSRTVLSEVVTKEPVAQEVKVGMKVNLPSGSHEDWMAAAGIDPSDYGYVNYIISHESSWRPDATNGRYWGLYQTTKARLINDCGENWVNDPVCQLRSATGYALSRYGSWQSAYEFWYIKRWW